jgi:Undecaprenyl-phosphate glucose phosphotransferase
MSATRGSGTAIRTADIAAAAVPQVEFRAQPDGRRLSAFIATLVLQEFLVITTATYLASAFYQVALFQEWPSAGVYVTSALFVGFMVVAVSIASGRYMNLQRRTRYTFMWGGLGDVALAFSFLLSGLFLLKVAEPYSRATFVIQFLSAGFAVVTNRAVAYARLQSATANGVLEARRVVFVGTGANCARFAVRLKGTGVRPVGFFPFPMGGAVNAMADAGGKFARSLIDECRAARPDDILILTSRDTLTQTSGLVASLSELPAGLHVAFVESADLLSAARVVEFGNIATLQISQPPLSAVEQLAKRMFDIVVAMGALAVLAPLMLMVAVVIKLDSRGPILFRQMRHGYNNETIKVFKFRTMTEGAADDGFIQATRDDRRITRVGRLLRRTSIDELPQLINVLSGEMSIVGPRPHATVHNEMFEKRISLFSRRHTVKPGITGWAQVNGYRGETDTLEKMERRVECDLYYIDNWSLLFDLRIMVMTLFSKSAYDNAC